MSENNILAFDSIFSINSMQLLKVLMPLIPGKFQPVIAIFIKYQELLYAYQYLQRHPCAFMSMEPGVSFEEKINQTLKEIRPYCSAEYVEYIDQIESVLDLLQKYKEFEPIFKVMEGVKPQGNADNFSKYSDMLNDLF